MKKKNTPQKNSEKEPTTSSTKQKLSLTPEQRETVKFISEIAMAWLAFAVFMFLFVVGFFVLLVEIFYLQSGAVTKLCLTAIETMLGFANRRIYTYLFPTKEGQDKEKQINPDKSLSESSTDKLTE
jgi:sensor histidine kinase YesM